MVGNNNKDVKPGRKARTGLLWGGAAAALFVGLVSLNLAGNRPRPIQGIESSETAAETGSSNTRNASFSSGAASKDAAAPSVKEVMLQEANPPDIPPEAPGNEIPSKKSYHKTDFRNFKTDMAGYKLDGVELTAEGIKLTPKKEGEEEWKGTLESAPQALSFPSNMVVPLWRSNEPDGTSMKIEVALSADNGEWTRWYPLDIYDEPMSPTYPDGSPNPNWGAKPGEPLGFGFELYPYVKYRMTLRGSSHESPTLEGVDFYHTDSTAGQGYLANDPPPEQIVEQEAARRQTQQ